MKRILSAILSGIVAAGNLSAQSLAEAARKEAERRRQLEEQGIEAKVIQGGVRSRGSGGSVTTFTREPEAKGASAPLKEPRGRVSASTYRRLLQKLDREIAECEERQAGLKRQADAEKWSLPRAGRPGRRAGTQSPQERLRKQAAELDARLRRLRLERMEAYEAGKKAGYLPGELDGKGIIP
jgi:hypothetical protein